MGHANQKGFTIIEVILFLGISAAFLLLAVTGIRGRTAAVQFTDSMRSLNSALVAEQNKLTNGVNSAQNAPTACGLNVPTGTSKDCVLIGRVVSFNDDSSDFESTALYGDRLTATQIVLGTDDFELIYDSEPRQDGIVESSRISWGTEFNVSKSFNSGATSDTFDRIGWLRSPSSSRIVPIAFSTDILGVDQQINYFKGNPPNNVTVLGDDVNTLLCFTGTNGQVASITFGDGTGSSAITLEFDDTRCL